MRWLRSWSGDGSEQASVASGACMRAVAVRACVRAFVQKRMKDARTWNARRGGRGAR